MSDKLNFKCSSCGNKHFEEVLQDATVESGMEMFEDGPHCIGRRLALSMYQLRRLFDRSSCQRGYSGQRTLACIPERRLCILSKYKLYVEVGIMCPERPYSQALRVIKEALQARDERFDVNPLAMEKICQNCHWSGLIEQPTRKCPNCEQGLALHRVIHKNMGDYSFYLEPDEVAFVPLSGSANKILKTLTDETGLTAKEITEMALVIANSAIITADLWRIHDAGEEGSHVRSIISRKEQTK